MSALYLGVDGGGTKTQFVCVDAAGRQLATTMVGTTYHLEIGLDEAVRRLQAGLSTITAVLNCDAHAFAHVFFGLPAYGEDSRVDPQLHTACGRLLGHARYTCGNDMICGWAGSLGCADGVNIVAGTGSIGYGERQGRAARAGGWGEVFGDEGSAYWIATRGLAAFSRMSDGRTSRGPLHGIVVNALSLNSDLDLLERVMGASAMSRAQIAALAPLVSAAAQEGDTAAGAILDAAADHLFALASVLRDKLGYPPSERARVSWSGSILDQVEPVRTRFAAALAGTGAFDTVAPLYPPGLGAALYAMKLSKLR